MPDNAKQNTEEHGKVLIQWSFFDVPVYSRSTMWYVVMSLLFLGIFTYAIFSNNILFAFILLLFVLVMIISNRNRKQIEFKIMEDGVSIGSRFYPYKDIEKFWIIYRPLETKTLYLHFNRLITPRIPIPIDDQNPVEIRKYLLKYIEEDLNQDEEPFSDKLSKILKI